MPVIENPWRNFDAFDPSAFAGKESEPPQWPVKLWKVPVQLATVFTPGENLEEDEDVAVKSGVRLVRSQGTTADEL